MDLLPFLCFYIENKQNKTYEGVNKDVFHQMIMDSTANCSLNLVIGTQAFKFCDSLFGPSLEKDAPTPKVYFHSIDGTADNENS